MNIDDFNLVNRDGQLDLDKLTNMGKFVAAATMFGLPGAGFFLLTQQGQIYSPPTSSLSGLEVEDSTGTPDYTAVTKLIIDHASFVLSQPAAGQVKIVTNLTVDTFDSGSGDSPVTVSNVTTIDIDQKSGLALANSSGKAQISAQLASTTHSGVVNTMAQTFGGVKTFHDGIVIQLGNIALFNPANGSYSGRVFSGTAFQQALVLESDDGFGSQLQLQFNSSQGVNLSASYPQPRYSVAGKNGLWSDYTVQVGDVLHFSGGILTGKN